MSDFVIHKGRRTAETFARHYGAVPTDVIYKPGERTAVVLVDGRTGVGSCLGCGSAPCMRKEDNELTLPGTLDAFPGDPSRDVCPTKAIRWDGDGCAAIIVADDCIGCGLCISRCPYGAISLANTMAACVETSDPSGLVIGGETMGGHPDVKRSGQIAAPTAAAATDLPAAVDALGDPQARLLVRNLLNEVGLNARTRRQGDTNMRIDALGFSRSERPFVAEIELGVGVLESPRALLEDIAVLHSRYDYAVHGIDPLSIILSLPNRRSEYYQVIRDIEKVLGIRCRTITIGALVALLWNCSKIDGFDGDSFALNQETIDLSDFLGLNGTALVEPYPGAFRPVK